jgi:hypothetical protein
MENKLAELGRRLLMLLRRRQFDRDLEEEMRLHRDLGIRNRSRPVFRGRKLTTLRRDALARTWL